MARWIAINSDSLPRDDATSLSTGRHSETLRSKLLSEPFAVDRANLTVPHWRWHCESICRNQENTAEREVQKPRLSTRIKCGLMAQVQTRFLREVDDLVLYAQRLTKSQASLLIWVWLTWPHHKENLRWRARCQIDSENLHSLHIDDSISKTPDRLPIKPN